MDTQDTDDEMADDRPAAPDTVYKYVTPDRIDVLQNASIRFTPPLNTNDIFEVRQTFDLLAGPKMRNLFDDQYQKIDFDEALADAFSGTPLAGMPPEDMKIMYRAITGVDLGATVETFVRKALEEKVFPAWNSPAAIDQLLVGLGRSLICLSLTERPDSSPMWAHYAANSSGFVIAFDTSNEFFRRGDAGERQGLQKITYFDGRVPEIMDDPYRALISKQADWAYEREWRLYLKSDVASCILKLGGEDIHLVEFPRAAVKRVVLGLRASAELEAELRAQLAKTYPGASLMRLKADRTAATLMEEPA